MIDMEKLMRIEAQVARMGDARRSRSERFRERVARSKELRTEAVWNALGEVQSMSLAELLAVSNAELTEAGVDVKTLRRAAMERRLADEELRSSPKEEADFAALATLAERCRRYAGETQ